MDVYMIKFLYDMIFNIGWSFYNIKKLNKIRIIYNCLNRVMTNMIFRYDVNIELSSDNIPKDIISLIFGHSFNQTVDMLPASIVELTFGYSFNQPVDMLPQKIKYLTFGHSFNQTVDMLPASIKELTFGYSFNQPVDMLPASMEELCFVGKCLLKILNSLKVFDCSLKKNSKKPRCCPQKEKCFKNENTPFSKKNINIDMIYKKGRLLFYNIKKIPYGCVYDSIIFV